MLPVFLVDTAAAPFAGEGAVQIGLPILAVDTAIALPFAAIGGAARGLLVQIQDTLRCIFPLEVRLPLAVFESLVTLLRWNIVLDTSASEENSLFL